MTASGKCRLDVLLVERGLSPSRERARALILAGRVLVNEQKVDKAGQTVSAEAALRILGDHLRYVSRGGLKLEGALDHWHIVVDGRACLDVGASTGGFTDCLLQRGAASVTAVDTGFGQIAMKLRNDARVRLMERSNARMLEPGSLGAEALLLVMDVSFISATLLLEPVFAAAPALREAVILVKPQFEAGREHVGKGGIVRDPAAHRLAIERVAQCVRSLGWQVVGTIPSPITGAEGNQEFLLYAKKTIGWSLLQFEKAPKGRRRPAPDQGARTRASNQAGSIIHCKPIIGGTILTPSRSGRVPHVSHHPQSNPVSEESSCVEPW